MKRTQLRRGTGLKRNTASRGRIFPAAGTPASPSARKTAAGRGGTGQRKAAPKGEFSPAVKLLVRLRAGRGDIFDAPCEACGKWLGEKGGEFQHRAARGSGGCRDAAVNGPANCVLLCHECHAKAEARDEHLAMDAGGFWIEHGTTPEYDPRNVSIMLHGAGGGGITVYLAADGLGPDGTGYLYARPKELAA